MKYLNNERKMNKSKCPYILPLNKISQELKIQQSKLAYQDNYIKQSDFDETPIKALNQG
ncbi:hypothetical protein A3Q56_04413, partial [Intoshia linei]